MSWRRPPGPCSLNVAAERVLAGLHHLEAAEIFRREELEQIGIKRGGMRKRRRQSGLRQRVIGRRQRLLPGIERGALHETREPAADRLTGIAALQRAGEIAEDGVAVVVERIARRGERQHAAAAAEATRQNSTRHCHWSWDWLGVWSKTSISPVMAGLVPAIHVLTLPECFARGATDVDARHKAGHDDLA
jgi:hypothetical protein